MPQVHFVDQDSTLALEEAILPKADGTAAK